MSLPLIRPSAAFSPEMDEKGLCKDEMELNRERLAQFARTGIRPANQVVVKSATNCHR